MSILAFDIEGDELLHKIQKVWCIATQDVETGEKQLFTPDRLDEGVAVLKKAATLVGHNIIGYDIPAIWKVLGKWETVPLIVDTLVTSRFLYPERPGGHSLDSWGERLGHAKQEFNDFSRYTPRMGEYCQNDVYLNVLVYKELEKEYGAALTGFKVYR